MFTAMRRASSRRANSPPRLLLEVDIGEHLPGVVPHDQARSIFRQFTAAGRGSKLLSSEPRKDSLMLWIALRLFVLSLFGELYVCWG